MDDESPKNTSQFRHAAFFVAVLLLIGAWKFGLEGVFE